MTTPYGRATPVAVAERYGIGHISPIEELEQYIAPILPGGEYEGRYVEMLFHSSNIGAGGGISEANFVAGLDYIQWEIGEGNLALLNPTDALYVVSS